MPIKTAPSTEIPFLQNYQPYSPPLGTTLVDELKDMITYDLQPTVNPTEVDYSIGTSKSYLTTLTIKNITTNVTIYIEVSFDKNIFIINQSNLIAADVVIDNEIPLLFTELQPNQTEQFVLEIRNGMLDQKVTHQIEQTQIKVKIRNIKINDVALKDITTSVFTTQALPTTITLD